MARSRFVTRSSPTSSEPKCSGSEVRTRIRRCSGGEAETGLALVEPPEQALEVGTREGPLEGLGDLLVVAFEREEPVIVLTA